MPEGLAAVLAGHIHRHQVLTRDLRGRPLAAPVLYPGSIERTSIAEADEEKGFMIVEIAGDASEARVEWHFKKLPARPLVRRDVDLDAIADVHLEPTIRSFVDQAPADAVLTIRVAGAMTECASRVLSAAWLRSVAPATMNIDLRIKEREGAAPRSLSRTKESDRLLELPLSR